MLERLHLEGFTPSLHGDLNIAGIHLGIRRQQEIDSQNSFPNIESTQEELADIKRSYLDRGGNFFVAQDSTDQRVLGFVGIMPDEEDKTLGAIKRFAVVKEERGNGIGTQLLTSLFEWARANDFTKLHLSTGKDENAIHLYEKFGFKTVGFDTDNQDWLMEADLAWAVLSPTQDCQVLDFAIGLDDLAEISAINRRVKQVWVHASWLVIETKGCVLDQFFKHLYFCIDAIIVWNDVL